MPLNPLSSRINNNIFNNIHLIFFKSQLHQFFSASHRFISLGSLDPEALYETHTHYVLLLLCKCESVNSEYKLRPGFGLPPWKLTSCIKWARGGFLCKVEHAHKHTQIKAQFIIAVLPATFYVIMIMWLCVTLSHHHAIYQIALCCGIGERELGFLFISSTTPLKAFPLMEWDTLSGQYRRKGDTK